MRILFTAAEALPYAKTGGLADVIGSLPKALQSDAVEVRIVIPLYKKIAQKYHQSFQKECSFSVYVGAKETPCTVYSAHFNTVCYYFIEHAGYFEREELYGYDDDGERFAFFQLAVVEMLHQLDYFPDIIHNNDWQTGMIPFLCRVKYGSDTRYLRMKQVYMIHNMAYQGYYPAEILPGCFGVSTEHYVNGTLRMHDGISYMKAGIVYADKIMTVSPSYAKEILTPQYGEQMENTLQFRSADLCGVVNGIDIQLWNPESDPLLFSNYTVNTVRKGKNANKKELQKELGLRVASDVLLVSMVSRLTWQKGVYLLAERMADIMGLDLQLVILGTGEHDAEEQFTDMEAKYRHRAVFYRGYNEELAHRIYAGSDLLLMPSLFEPCGISQLIAMRYGTLPLVRETGGLRDTVKPYNEYTKEGTGFSFSMFSGTDLYHVLRYASLVYYERPSDYRQLITQAMEKDVSWAESAKQYEALYHQLLQ